MDYKQAKRWYVWLATLAGNLPADTQRVERQPQPPPVARTPANDVRHATWPHDIKRDGDKLRCDMCARYVSVSASSCYRRAFLSSQCQGPIAGRAVSNQATGVPHRLLLSGCITWCCTCGRYSEKRANALVCRACDGPPVGYGGRDASLRRLLRGQHPKHPGVGLPPAIPL